MNMSPHDSSAPDIRRLVSWGITRQALAALPILLAALLASGCTTVHPPAGPGQSSLPVLSGWFEGEEVFYINTDVSQADVAEAKGRPRGVHQLSTRSPSTAPTAPTAPVKAMPSVYHPATKAEDACGRGRTPSRRGWPQQAFRGSGSLGCIGPER